MRVLCIAMMQLQTQPNLKMSGMSVIDKICALVIKTSTSTYFHLIAPFLNAVASPPAQIHKIFSP